MEKKIEKFIGKLLRETREMKKLSLADVVRDTKISVKYLQALEEENYKNFPAEVYLIGFLNSYSKYLGLDADGLLREYRQTHEKGKEPINKLQKNLFESTDKGKKKLYQKKASIALIIILVVIGLLFSFFLKKVQMGVDRKNFPGKDIYQIGPSVQRKSQIVEKIYLEAKGKTTTWIRITGDGKLIYEGLIKDGEEKTWEAKENFKLRIGNIYGLEVKFNGEPVDIISGQRGEVNEILLERKP